MKRNIEKLKFHNGVMECPQCGHHILINFQVCDQCGHQLSAEEFSAVRRELGISFWGWALKASGAAIVVCLLGYVLNIV